MRLPASVWLEYEDLCQPIRVRISPDVIEAVREIDDKSCEIYLSSGNVVRVKSSLTDVFREMAAIVSLQTETLPEKGEVQ